MKRQTLSFLIACCLLAGCASKQSSIVGTWIQEPNANSKGTIHTITFYSDGIFEDTLKAEKAPTSIINRGKYTIQDGKLFTAPENVDLVAFSRQQKQAMQKNKDFEKQLMEPDSGKLEFQGNDKMIFTPDKPAKGQKGPAAPVVFNRKKAG